MSKAYAFTSLAEPNEISAFLHCGECLAELPDDQSPREYAQLEVGYTRDGIQIWCKRHEHNVLHLKWPKGDKTDFVNVEEVDK